VVDARNDNESFIVSMFSELTHYVRGHILRIVEKQRFRPRERPQIFQPFSHSISTSIIA
jgi:hypothetical protein